MRGIPSIPDKDGTMIRLSGIVRHRSELAFMVPDLEAGHIRWEYKYHTWTVKDGGRVAKRAGWALWREW